MKRGEVWTIELPETGVSREQAERRPALIVQDEQIAGSSPLVIVVPLSSQIRTMGFPGCLMIDPTSENGLSFPSGRSVFNFEPLTKRRVVRRLGILSSADLEKVDNQLRNLLRL